VTSWPTEHVVELYKKREVLYRTRVATTVSSVSQSAISSFVITLACMRGRMAVAGLRLRRGRRRTPADHGVVRRASRGVPRPRVLAACE